VVLLDEPTAGLDVHANTRREALTRLVEGRHRDMTTQPALTKLATRTVYCAAAESSTTHRTHPNQPRHPDRRSSAMTNHTI